MHFQTKLDQVIVHMSTKEKMIKQVINTNHLDQIVAIKVIDIKKEDDLHKQFTNDEITIL